MWIAVLAAIAVVGFAVYRKVRTSKAPQVAVANGEEVAYVRL